MHHLMLLFLLIKDYLGIIGVFIPFLTFCVIRFNTWMSKRDKAWFCLYTSFISPFLFFLFLKTGVLPQYHSFGTWNDFLHVRIEYVFLFDRLSVSMCLLVSFISALVHLYSVYYMAEDPEFDNFMAYLSFFTFCMYSIVVAGNLICSIFGWELVGLTSFLLINFWSTRRFANKSALKAILVNKIGDVFFFLAIVSIMRTYHTVDFLVLNTLTPFLTVEYPFANINISFVDLSTLALLGAGMAKSAQLGLHTWLPDAMEGPSPVSALIHAATMVTAGIYSLVRFSPILEYSNITLYFMILLGSLTALFAATTAFAQNDLKRVIAYSTCSQLGYFMMACGFSGYDFAMFHLYNHAVFKALLFLGAGAIIHALADEQDMRKMGGLINHLILSYICITLGSLSLTGFPFLTGFYSKDGILELTASSSISIGLFALILGNIAAFFTAIYSIRLLILTFYGQPNWSRTNISEAPSYMAFVLFVLSFLSIFLGYGFKDVFIGLNTPFWDTAINLLPQHLNSDAEFLPSSVKLLPVLVSCLGFFCGILIYHYFPVHFLYRFFKSIYTFLNYKWFFDPIYNYFLVRPILFFGHRISFEILDRGFFEHLGAYGLVRLIKWCIDLAHKAQPVI